MAKACCNGGFINPYNKTDYRDLKEAQRLLTELLPVLDKIENCGQECDVFRSVSDELMSRLTAIETNFMTPIPRK